MIRIGIDTSVIVGLLDKKDTWHEKAFGFRSQVIVGVMAKNK